jgi:PAS domain S-box-containing protein
VASPHQDASRLLHELQVHQVELEIQNEDLRRAQVALEEAQARHVDLYDFAPVGYLTLDAKGLVAEANQTAAGMLNVDRGSLVGKRFAPFVGGDSATWRRFLHVVARSSDSANLNMPIQREDGSVFDGHLVCQHRAEGADGGSVRVVLSDVSEQRGLEEKLGESRKAEEAMAVSEAKYRGLFDSMMDGVVVVEMAGTIVESNETFRTMLGYGADELRKLTYTQLTPEPWHAMEARIVAEQILPRGHSDVYEKEYRRKDGTVFPVELRTFLLRENGRPSAMWAIVRDLTERKRAEQSLRVQEARLDLAVRSGKTGLWDLDLVTNQAWRTPQHDRLFGYDGLQPTWGAEEALRHMVPEDQPVVRKAFDDALVTGTFHCQFRITPANHPLRWVEASGEVHRDESGAAVRMMGTVVDVTESKASEERLREALAYARSLLEASLDPLVTISPEGKVTDVNAATEAATGLPRERIVGTDFADYFTEPERARAGYRQVLVAGSIRDYPLSIRHASGRTTDVIYSASVYRDRAGRVQGVFAAARDVTEVRALQAQVALASRLAAMGTLVAGVAHEINNPLAAELADQGLAIEIAREVRGRLVAGDPLDRPSEARLLAHAVEALEDAQESGQRIARIVKNLATFGRPDVRRRRLRLSEVVASASRWLPSTVERSAEVRFEDGGAPDVVASAGQLEQVVVNLVVNGARAIPEGRRGLVLVRTGPGSQGMARLEVRDDGTGIPPSIRERIFEPFFTSRPTGPGRGMGLGLAICHSIVTAHGGTISVESEVGKGSTFRVELPAAPDA